MWESVCLYVQQVPYSTSVSSKCLQGEVCFSSSTCSRMRNSGRDICLHQLRQSLTLQCTHTLHWIQQSVTWCVSLHFCLNPWQQGRTVRRHVHLWVSHSRATETRQAWEVVCVHACSTQQKPRHINDTITHLCDWAKLNKILACTTHLNMPPLINYVLTFTVTQSSESPLKWYAEWVSLLISFIWAWELLRPPWDNNPG